MRLQCCLPHPPSHHPPSPLPSLHPSPHPPSLPPPAILLPSLLPSHCVVLAFALQSHCIALQSHWNRLQSHYTTVRADTLTSRSAARGGGVDVGAYVDEYDAVVVWGFSLKSVARFSKSPLPPPSAISLQKETTRSHYTRILVYRVRERERDRGREGGMERERERESPRVGRLVRRVSNPWADRKWRVSVLSDFLSPTHGRSDKR